MHELIITNGDSTVELMRQAGFTEQILPWKDVLHDGPVPGCVTRTELTAIRSEFLSKNFRVRLETIQHDFRKRDEILDRISEFSQVSLWFEHDLYDQLQLAQIISVLQCNSKNPPLAMMQADSHLGLTPAPQMPALRHRLRPLQQQDTEYATEFWQLFTGQDPLKLNAFSTDAGPLVHLATATKRLLQTFPFVRNGLTLTQQLALTFLRDGPLSMARVFSLYLDAEKDEYAGDWSFMNYLAELAFAPTPLISGITKRFSPHVREHFKQEISLTQTGRDILEGKKNHLKLNGIDRWIGGTHLTAENLYCWDPEQEVLCKI